MVDVFFSHREITTELFFHNVQSNYEFSVHKGATKFHYYITVKKNGVDISVDVTIQTVRIQDSNQNKKFLGLKILSIKILQVFNFILNSFLFLYVIFIFLFNQIIPKIYYINFLMDFAKAYEKVIEHPIYFFCYCDQERCLKDDRRERYFMKGILLIIY
jgi:hypothetical protein